MAQNLSKHKHEGVWFSKNGHRAYMRGEKPWWLWPLQDRSRLVKTCPHHITVRADRWGIRWKRYNEWFYTKPGHCSIISPNMKQGSLPSARPAMAASA